jgi:sugar phosphate isomerase/epimerase
MTYTRREFGRLTLAGMPAAGLLLSNESWLRAAQTKPNSKWAGVQVGLNMPYDLHTPVVGNNVSGDDVLAACLQVGVSAVELRTQSVEMYLGSPTIAAQIAAAKARAAESTAAAGGGRAAGRGGGGAGTAPTPTPEQQAAQKAAAEELRKWRLAAPMSKVREFRKKFEDAGVKIEIVKFDNANIYSVTDDVVDWSFELAKALGARAISCEISAENTRRIGQFADKHQMMVGYHGHTETGPKDWELAFSQAKFNGANLDLGHFVAGNRTSPVPFLKQYHDRITHVHVKDRKLTGENVTFGEGDTPIKEALQLMSAQKWNIQATIENEYAVPQGSTVMAEIAKCVAFCKQCLA